MQSLSSIHPDAPRMLTASALMSAPIDLEAAVQRFALLWSEKIEPSWESATGSDGVEQRILHCETRGVHILLTPVNMPLVVAGTLPEHCFYVAATFYAPPTVGTQTRYEGESAHDTELGPLHFRHRMVDAHVVMTELMDAMMREPAAVGVYREELGVVLPPTMVTNFANLLTQGQPPIPLWVNCRVQRPDLSFGRTFGLPCFGHLDLQVRESTHGEDDVYDLLSNIASYIITSDTHLLPGQTFGMSADQPIGISQEISHVDGASVIRLDF
ncbi:DUF4261 domain-containing protein [Trueperella sp. LYQ143]|uniref:DUF4261 domain-containing protein n=1 Tax=Trueperella sp. LYQ143 TaxID=3391059 RepID=UPI0039834F51